MAFKIGQSQTVFDQWESDSIDVEFGYKKPTHPSILDIELEAVTFDTKWQTWDYDKSVLFAELYALATPDDDESVNAATLIERMEPEAQKAWLKRLQDLKSMISSDDLKPVYQFISQHIITVGGIIGQDGKPVKLWADLDDDAKTEVLTALTPYEVASFYGEIKRSAMLKASEKKP